MCLLSIIWEWVNTNFNAIGTLCLTAALMYYTRKLWVESKIARIQNLTPQISIIFYLKSRQEIHMQVVNSGKNDARNVEIICNTDFKYKFLDDMCNLKNMLSKKYDYIPIGQSFDYFIGMNAILNGKVINFNISFYDIFLEHETKYPINITLDYLEDYTDTTNYLQLIVSRLSDISARIK